MRLKKLCDECYWYNEIEKKCRLSSSSESLCKWNKYKNFDKKNWFNENLNEIIEKDKL